MKEKGVERRLTTILAADVVGYSRLMSADEAGTLALLNAVRRELIEPKAALYGGRLVKLMGDGTLMEFSSVIDAVNFAGDVQLAMSERAADIPEDRRITLRIGINIGDIIVEGDDIFGDGVNIAARLEGLAEPGGVCIARNVFSQVKGKVGLAFEDLGEKEVKNIPEPVRVYRSVSPSGGAHARDQEDRGKRQLEVSDEPSIAVLPFDNLSGDPEQAYFTDGITEDVTTGLSRFHSLHVVARNSSSLYRDTAVDVREVGRALDVRYVVEGSVRKAGERVRITVQLIDATSGHHLWAERYDRELRDIFAVQDEITETIVSTLAVKVEDEARERAKRKKPQNLVAYDYVLRGDEEILEYTKERSDRAKEFYFKAIELDPTYARAFAGIAFAYLSDWGFLWTETPDEALDSAVDYARKAVALDDAESRSHWVLAYVLSFHQNYEEARFHQKRAIALNPNDADVLAKMGFVLPILGEYEEAIELVTKAMRLNPHHPSWYNTFLGMALFAAHRYQEAIAAFKKSGDLYPEDNAWMAAALAQQEDFDAARKVAEAFVETAGPKPWWSHVPDSTKPIERDPTGLLTFMNYMYPYENQTDRDHLLDGLRNAGL